jgi:MFS family permease
MLSFFWGKMSDKYGRRPIMLIGTCGTMISTVIFGFSKYYGLAITARFISGLLNGNYRANEKLDLLKSG